MATSDVWFSIIFLLFQSTIPRAGSWMECFLFSSIEALSGRLDCVGAFRFICWISFLKLRSRLTSCWHWSGHAASREAQCALLGSWVCGRRRRWAVWQRSSYCGELEVAREHLFWELLRLLDGKGIAPVIPKYVVTILLVGDLPTSMIL